MGNRVASNASYPKLSCHTTETVVLIERAFP